MECVNIYIYYLSHSTHNVKYYCNILSGKPIVTYKKGCLGKVSSPSIPFLLCGRKWKRNLTLQPSIPFARKKKTKTIRREGFLPFPSFHKWTWNHKSQTNSHTHEILIPKKKLKCKISLDMGWFLHVTILKIVQHLTVN